MPLATTTPISLGEINTWQITGFEADTGAPALNITLARGLRGEDGVIAWAAPLLVEVRGADLLAAYGQAPQGATVYEVIKRALYAYLKMAGVVPADAEEP